MSAKLVTGRGWPTWMVVSSTKLNVSQTEIRVELSNLSLEQMLRRHLRGPPPEVATLIAELGFSASRSAGTCWSNSRWVKAPPLELLSTCFRPLDP